MAIPTTLPTRILGRTGVPIPAVGLGCMGMSVSYGPSDGKEVQATLQAALEDGCYFWDTSDVYGFGHNERLLAPYLKEHRDKIFLCTKFGFSLGDDGSFKMRGDPEWVRQACEASLERLGVSTIDLYYQHRVDPDTPIEETVRAMKQLQDEGKVKYLGLSECSAETLRRALKVARIEAVQIEYSPWSTDIETNGILDVCREHGITLVAYSPLGRGMLTGEIKSPADFAPDDYRRILPRFMGEAFTANMKLVDGIKAIAERKGTTAGQLSLAWVLAQGPEVVAIPGTRKVNRLRENEGGAKVVLSDEEEKEIRKLVEEIGVQGQRYDPQLMALSGL